MKKVIEITGIPPEHIFKLGTDGYGTKRPNTYGILHKCPLSNEQIIKSLTDAGWTLVDPQVLSYVHGYWYVCIYPPKKKVTCLPPYRSYTKGNPITF